MKRFSIYVHIPFCAKKCNYCNFVSFCGKEDMIEEYITALEKEMSIYSKVYKEDYLASSIFIGGGTPSMLPTGYISRIIKAIKEHFTVALRAEITVECNPNSITEEKLMEYKEAGVNRLSIGGQSINDNILKLIGRVHDFKTLDASLNMAKKVGFRNINVDMLLGLPSQKMKDVKKMLKYLVKKGVTHISAYSLIVEDRTPIKHQIQSGALQLPTEDETVAMYDFVVKFLKKHGINRYEVSNFAVPDCECKHNLNYWEMGEYLGLGVASHSFMEYTRYNNFMTIEKYVETLKAGKRPVENKEKASLTSLREETMMLGLRTTRGVFISRYNNLFNCNLLEDKKKEIRFLQGNNLINIENGRIIVDDDAFYVLDSIIQKLI